MSWQKQKKRQGGDGETEKALKFKTLERPDISSAIDEAETALQDLQQKEEEPRSGRCGCWR